jgi:sulfide:quinone oxidoreductase
MSTETKTNHDPLNVLVAGGGVAGLETIIALRALAGDRLCITLVDPAEDFVYKPLSVVEPFARGAAAHLSLAKVAADFDVDHRRARVARVRATDRTLVTSDGEELPYEALVLALGARREPSYRHAVSFRGQEDSEAVHGLIQDLELGHLHRIAFVVPPGSTWTLPLYELALMTAQRAFDMSAEVELTLITPEHIPLEVFGAEASHEVGELLEAAGIEFEGAAYADVEAPGEIHLRPHGRHVSCDRVVALPTLWGTTPIGVPADERGFVPTDLHCRVRGIDDVYAAGDGTQFPLKQGGVATQQADIVAAGIAQRVGVQVQPQSFTPVLRAKLLTGGKERFLRTDVVGGRDQPSGFSEHALWWPPSKIAGAYLAPYLAGDGDGEQPPAHRDGLEIELPFDRIGPAAVPTASRP